MVIKQLLMARYSICLVDTFQILHPSQLTIHGQSMPPVCDGIFVHRHVGIAELALFHFHTKEEQPDEENSSRLSNLFVLQQYCSRHGRPLDQEKNQIG